MGGVNITPATLEARHRIIIGQQPEETAFLLYRQYPGQHGYCLNGLSDRSRFEATVVLALAQAFEDPAVRVVFFVPRTLELGAIATFKDTARGMFGRLKARRDTMPKEALQAAVDLYKRVFSQVMIGSEPTREAPKHWVGYGFLEQDPRIPLWLREGLL